MGRPNYVCTTRSEHFTRKYSAKRHNITVHHNNGGEIVTLVEYIVGRKSGRYQATHPSWYRRGKEKRIHNFGVAAAATVADSMGDVPRSQGLERGQGQHQYHEQSLEQQERYHRQLESLSPSPAAIQDQPPDVQPYPPDQTFQSQSMNTTDNDETTTMSQETILKIEELKRLVELENTPRS